MSAIPRRAAYVVKIRRLNDLATIYIAKKKLFRSGDDYRAMLWSHAGARSAAELDVRGRIKVLSYLQTISPHVSSRRWLVRVARRRLYHRPLQPDQLQG